MEYVSRKTWGARHAAGSGPRALPCEEAWLHHTTSVPPVNTLAAEQAAMRQIEATGQQRFGQGFSYNLAIMPSGRAYVGCGVDRIGSHTQGRNTRALGIVLVGNYHGKPVPAAMRSALVAVLRDAKAQGWLREAKLNGGHRDLKATACPGDNAYALIPAINKAAAAAPAKPPPTWTTPTPPADPNILRCDMYVMASTGKSTRLVTPGKATVINGAELKALRACQVPESKVTADEYDLILRLLDRV